MKTIKLSQNIAQQWREVLNINSTARNREWKTYLSDLSNLDYQVARSAWIGDYYDPNTFYDCFVSRGGNNRTGWENDEYDALLAASQATIDPDERQKIFDRNGRNSSERGSCYRTDLLITFIQGLLKEEVLAFEHNPRDYHPFQYIWLEPVE